MGKEFRIEYEDISDPAKVTQANIKAFKENGLDIHRHEVETNEGLINDDKKRQRIVRVKNTKYFGPWSHRG